MPHSQEAQNNVQESLDSVTSNPENGIPGVVFVAVDKEGEYIVQNASGKRGLTGKKPMDMDTVFWIASCTKLLASIVCMQLVEKGTSKSDDPSQVYKLCPELEKIKVLKDDGTLEDRKEDITLRMLLSHTAGFGYEFFNPKSRDYGRPMGFDVFQGDHHDILNMPLVNQPGSRWEYGTNIDWAGIMAERATGDSSNDSMHKQIFEPLGLKNITMFPTQEMKANLASMHQKWPGTHHQVQERDHVYRRPLLAESDHEKKHIINSGGAGCYAKPAEYVQVLAALLNDGTHPKTGKQILKPETIATMWENQISQWPDFAREGIPAAKPEYTNELPESYPQEGNPPQGWGLSFMSTQEPAATGRGKNTACWAGIANSFWWCDRERGVAGMIASQVMPFGDMGVSGQYAACEAAVYKSL